MLAFVVLGQEASLAPHDVGQTLEIGVEADTRVARRYQAIETRDVKSVSPQADPISTGTVALGVLARTSWLSRRNVTEAIHARALMGLYGSAFVVLIGGDSVEGPESHCQLAIDPAKQLDALVSGLHLVLAQTVAIERFAIL